MSNEENEQRMNLLREKIKNKNLQSKPITTPNEPQKASSVDNTLLAANTSALLPQSKPLVPNTPVAQPPQTKKQKQTPPVAASPPLQPQPALPPPPQQHFKQKKGDIQVRAPPNFNMSKPKADTLQVPDVINTSSDMNVRVSSSAFKSMRNPKVRFEENKEAEKEPQRKQTKDDTLKQGEGKETLEQIDHKEQKGANSIDDTAVTTSKQANVQQSQYTASEFAHQTQESANPLKPQKAVRDLSSKGMEVEIPPQHPSLLIVQHPEDKRKSSDISTLQQKRPPAKERLKLKRAGKQALLLKRVQKDLQYCYEQFQKLAQMKRNNQLGPSIEWKLKIVKLALSEG